MKNKLLQILALCLTCALILTACGGKDSDSAAESHTLKAGSLYYFASTNLDPAEEWNGWYMSFFGVTETLFRFDEAYNANPWLVESVETPDDNTWVLTLKDGVKFHNGKAMTAETVKKCFERTYEVNSRAADTLAIESIEADGQKLTIKTPSANPNVASFLCDPLLSVYYVGDDENYAENTFCTGPFTVEEFTANDICKLTAFNQYWGGTPKLSKAELITFADDDSLAAAMQNGDIDMVAPIASASLPLFEDESKYQIFSVPNARAHMLEINMESSIMKDHAVRKAFAMCIDREGYAREICNETCNANYGVFPETLSFGSTDSLKLDVDKYDVDGAKKVLSDAGWNDTNGDGILDKNGQELSVTMMVQKPIASMVELADVMTSVMGEIGVKITVETYEQLDTNDMYEGKNWDLSMHSCNMAPQGVPEYLFNNFLTTGAGTNHAHYSNKKVDKLTAKLGKTFDTEERQQLVYEIEQEVLDDIPFIFFGCQTFSCVGNTNIKDFNIQPSEYYFLDAKISI